MQTMVPHKLYLDNSAPSYFERGSVKKLMNIPQSDILDIVLLTPKNLFLIETTLSIHQKTIGAGSLYLCSLANDYHDDELLIVSKGLDFWLGFIKIIKNGSRILLKLPGYKRKFFNAENSGISVWRIEKTWDINNFLSYSNGCPRTRVIR